MVEQQSMDLRQIHWCVAWLSLCCLLSAGAQADEVAARPNVIIIQAADLGYGDLGVYGATAIQTPRLDRMASEGVILTHAYASSSLGAPSQAGLLTGRYPVRSRVAGPMTSVEDSQGLPTKEITIAEMLKAGSYQTAMIGKWHLGHTEEYWPTRQGFDYFFGMPHSNDQHAMALYRNAEKIEESVDQASLTSRYTAEAIAFLEEHRDQPFFIYLAHTVPHAPLSVPAEFEFRSSAGQYGDVVEMLDWSTGEILDTLERLGIDDNTLVIFTSDNGPYQGGSTGGLRGTKGTPWEGGYRVPFIARWPARIPPNTSSSGISMNLDVLPTIQAATSAQLPEGLVLDGKNIIPVLMGSGQSPHEKLYFFSDDRIAAIRTPGWKAVMLARYRGINRWLPDHDVDLLFDMTVDPYERYSMAAHQPEIWQQMMQYWQDGVQQLESLSP